MTLADRIIHTLRHQHDRLAEVAGSLDDAALTGPSGAAEWRICDVFSHLGSGAEIMLRPLTAAVAHTAPAQAGNQQIWDRWNASSPREQARGFVEHDTRLLEVLEALDGDARASLQVDLGFLPAPVSLEMAAGMRLNEVALHAWDVHAGLEPGARLDDDAAEIILALLAGPMSMMLHWSSKPDTLAEPAVVAIAGHGLAINDDVVLVADRPFAPTATFTGPDEAAVRLMAGRLTPPFTPEGVEVVGNVTLDDLRGVFPGY